MVTFSPGIQIGNGISSLPDDPEYVPDERPLPDDADPRQQVRTTLVINSQAIDHRSGFVCVADPRLRSAFLSHTKAKKKP